MLPEISPTPSLLSPSQKCGILHQLHVASGVDRVSRGSLKERLIHVVLMRPTSMLEWDVFIDATVLEGHAHFCK